MATLKLKCPPSETEDHTVAASSEAPVQAQPDNAEFLSSFSTTNRPKLAADGPLPGTLAGIRYNCTVPWNDFKYIQAGLIEFTASIINTFLSGLIGITLAANQTTNIFAYAGLSNVFLLSLIIFATAPASGGHFNPLISTVAFLSGMMELPRYVCYIAAQILGSVIGGAFIRGVLGTGRTASYHGGGCFVIPGSEVTSGEIFLLEFVSSFCLCFLAVGVGLDPRAGEAFGPILGPIFTACSLGLVSFSSANLIAGFTGAGCNPSRCLGLAVARGQYQYLWIWWIAPLCAAIWVACLYYVAPPYRRR